MKVEFSNGDIVDRYTILSIKKERISDIEKVKNIQREHDVLENALVELDISKEDELCIKLKTINEKLWEIEDKIRIKEKQREFDDEFVRLARSVYFANDERAFLKREINILTKSLLIEEKEYQNYK